jgi:hypothetical protein
MSNVTTITASPTSLPSSSLLEPKMTFWETLSEDDRRESINERMSRKLGSKTGWGYAGLVQQKWNEEVYPAISLIINNKENYEKIFRRVNTRVIRPCALYMIGRSDDILLDKLWERARPTIVTISSRLKVARKLCSLLKDSACLKNMNLGFDFMCFEDQTLILTAGDGKGSEEFDHEHSLCGIPIWTPGFQDASSFRYQRASIGGCISIDKTPLILTVAHAFYPDDFYNQDDDDSSSSEISMEDSSMITNREPSEPSDSISRSNDHLLNLLRLLRDKDAPVFRRPLRIEDDRRFVQMGPNSPDSKSLTRIGHLDQQSIPPDIDPVFCPGLDWALISPDSPDICKVNRIRTPTGKVLLVDSISSSPPAVCDVVVSGGTSGVFASQLSGRIEGIILPGSMHMQEVWTIDSACRT